MCSVTHPPPPPLPLNNGEDVLLECLENEPHLHEKYLQIFKVFSFAFQLLAEPGRKSTEQRELAANACEHFCELFPVLFERNMTRKMHCWSIVLPRSIRQHGDYYKYLRLEQAGEQMHHLLNLLEVQYGNVKNEVYRFYLMIKAIENKLNCDMTIFQRKQRVLKFFKIRVKL